MGLIKRENQLSATCLQLRYRITSLLLSKFRLPQNFLTPNKLHLKVIHLIRDLATRRNDKWRCDEFTLNETALNERKWNTRNIDVSKIYLIVAGSTENNVGIENWITHDKIEINEKYRIQKMILFRFWIIRLNFIEFWSFYLEKSSLYWAVTHHFIETIDWMSFDALDAQPQTMRSKCWKFTNVKIFVLTRRQMRTRKRLYLLNSNFIPD